jgi:hypothetical protein
MHKLEEDVEYFYDLNISFGDIKSIKCYNCNKIYQIKNEIYLKKIIFKTYVFSTSFFNYYWKPFCDICKNNIENIVTKKLN